MKTILLFSLLLLGFVSYGQNIPTKPEPFKGSNVIVIETTQNAADAYKKIAMLLQDHGYAFKSTDKDLLSITTEMNNNGFYGDGEMSLSAYVRGEENAKIFLSGQFSIPVLSKAVMEIDYRGMKGSATKNSFEKMHDVAKAYEGGKLLYGNR